MGPACPDCFIFCAGYETTATSLGFAVYCLCANPDKAAKVAEVRMQNLSPHTVIPGHQQLGHSFETVLAN